VSPLARRIVRITWPIAAALLVAGIVRALLGGREMVPLHVGARTVEILRPQALYLVALVPIVFGLLPLSLVDLPHKQQRLGAGLRSLFIVVLAVALARPATLGERRNVATVLLVDVSDSISDAQLEAARKLVEDARTQRKGDDVLRLVTFARHPRVVELPPDGTPLARLERHAPKDDNAGSDLDEALELAYTLYPPGTIQRAVLVSDGNETEGNVAAQALTAHDRRVHVDVVSFAAEQLDEVLVRAVDLPADVKVGAPFEVVAHVFASRAQPATVTLFRDEFVNPHDGRKEVQLTAGENVVRWKSEVTQPGFTTFRAQVSGRGGKLRDHFADNNQAVASVAVKGKPRILYVEGEPQAAGYLANALKRENIDVEVRSAYGLPSSPRELARYDLVLVSDVPAMYVGPQQMAALEAYVRDLGGGFIMAGGESSFGSGGWTGSKMEQLLPVRFDVERKRDQPSLALVLAIDRSGSMQAENKLELAKDAAKATAELLGADDLIGVHVFDQIAQPVVRLQRAANRTRILTQIASIQAGGGTNILPALRLAYEELDPVAAKVKHVILLTDGQASYDGIAQLVDEMVEHKITVSAVGVGGEADKTLLTMIAERGGGRFYHTMDASNVPKIFTKETSQVARSSLVEDAIGVQVVKHVELLDGTGIESAPPLRGYVSVKPKPMSELILAARSSASAGEPLLARWRVGLGQAVAFTSDVKNRWAVDWIKWPGYGKFWAHLVRSTMRHTPGQTGGATGASFELAVDVDPPHARVAVDAVSADDRFLSGLDSTLQIVDPAHPESPREVPLVQTAAGRYEGDFTLDRYGAFLLRARHRQNGVEIAESAGTLSVPYPREYLALPPDEALLKRVADLTGGRVRPSPAQLFDAGDERVPFYRELWPFALWLAAILLLCDVAARRVRLFRA
jgi:uncharacterized membrane protein